MGNLNWAWAIDDNVRINHLEGKAILKVSSYFDGGIVDLITLKEIEEGKKDLKSLDNLFKGFVKLRALCR